MFTTFFTSKHWIWSFNRPWERGFWEHCAKRRKYWLVKLNVLCFLPHQKQNCRLQMLWSWTSPKLFCVGKSTKYEHWLNRPPDRGGYFDFRFKIFNYSALNSMLLVLIESSHWDNSNEYPQHRVSLKNNNFRMSSPKLISSSVRLFSMGVTFVPEAVCLTEQDECIPGRNTILDWCNCQSAYGTCFAAVSLFHGRFCWKAAGGSERIFCWFLVNP